LSIGGTRVNTPDEFTSAARKIEGSTTLQVYRGSDRLESLTVAE
jgi:hypothetical protein